MMPRESAGGVIVNEQGEIVLVEQHGNSWSFPKGRVEEGESLLDAATREIAEETGVTDLQLVKELGSYERYSLAKDGISDWLEAGLRKRTLFLFTTSHNELRPADREVTKAVWVSIDEAIPLLTHPKDKEFLESVRGDIEHIRIEE